MTVEIDTIEETKTRLAKPKKWALILHNDDVTPMDFVVMLLNYVFKFDIVRATELMLKVHTQGQAVVGVYPYEIAEQKYSESQLLIKASNMSLKITMEKES